MPTRRTRGIRRAKVGPSIIDKVKNAFNKPKTQQVQHKTPEQKVTTRQVAHKMPDAEKPKSMSKPTTTKIPSTRPTTSTAPTTTPVMDRGAYAQNFTNRAQALMQRKSAFEQQPQHFQQYAASGNLGEGLSNVRLEQRRGTPGTGRRDYNIIETDQFGGVSITPFAQYQDQGIKDAINKNFTRYRDRAFINTDPMYQTFRRDYGKTDSDKSYIQYNSNLNSFSLIQGGVTSGGVNQYFSDAGTLMEAGRKLSGRQ